MHTRLDRVCVPIVGTLGQSFQTLGVVPRKSRNTRKGRPRKGIRQPPGTGATPHFQSCSPPRYYASFVYFVPFVVGFLCVWWAKPLPTNGTHTPRRGVRDALCRPGASTGKQCVRPCGATDARILFTIYFHNFFPLWLSGVDRKRFTKSWRTKSWGFCEGVGQRQSQSASHIPRLAGAFTHGRYPGSATRRVSEG